MGESVDTVAGQPKSLISICAIGASAGGVAALRNLFSHLREDLDLAYVVIVHLSPDHPSAMHEILATCTSMLVLQADASRALEPNTVYVIPPDRELVIKGDDIAARPFTQPRGKRAPIDMFFRSIAAGRGDGLAVILSGSGADGSIGVRAMKEAGGVVFVQDPSEAEYSMMPQNAIATGAADFVAPVGQLTDLIGEVARAKKAGSPPPAGDGIADLRRIITFMRDRTGHDFSNYKRATVTRRVSRRIQITRCSNWGAYADYLRDNPEEARELFADLLISVTMFFRDTRAFEVLTAQVVPGIFEELDEYVGIRGWVVGCATGEEAYSIAILLLEEAERRRIKIPIQIFASDLDESALARAREGRYPRSIELDVSEERLQRWFVDEGAHYRVRQELRDVVLFENHSVLKDPPFLKLDLITCRNLMIYLERPLQRQLNNLFHYALQPQRFLFLGSAETVDTTPELFGPIDREARIYRARPQATRVLPKLPELSEDLRTSPLEPRRHTARDEHEGSATYLHMAALERNTQPSVLVDEAQRIINLSPSAGAYILHSGGPFTAELPAVVRPELRLDLKMALERAFERRQPTLTLPVLVVFDGAKRRVAMHVVPTVADAASAHQALVYFIDGGVSEELDEPRDGDLATKPHDMRRLYDELKIAHERLNTSRREHEVAVQDLRAANEELQSINEEYRSTAEELETSKEELQSINEELQTVNAELKSKLESISSAHNDLQNLTSATEIGTLFLSPELKIRMFTAPVAQLFNITNTDVGRAITNFTHQLVYEGLERDARRLLRDLAPVETVVESKRGHAYMMRMRPYRTLEDRIEGIVVTFVDISARLIAEKQLRDSEDRYRLLFDSIDQGFCVIEVLFDAEGEPVDYRFVDVNAAFERQTGLANAVGQTMLSLEPRHEKMWVELYARVATTQSPERFEQNAIALGRYYEGFAFPVGELALRQVGILFNDVTKRKQSETHLRLMVDELNHRVKNTLAVVQAIAQQTFKRGEVDLAARRAFEGRLMALARTHNLLTQTHWERAALQDIAASVTQGCGAYEHRFRIDGHSVDLQVDQAVPVALALHELCTNAVKYGALSNEAGTVHLTWRVTSGPDSKLRIEWREEGGPTVQPPARRGFGSLMVEGALAQEISGQASIEFKPEGVVCVIEGPFIARLEA